MEDAGIDRFIDRLLDSFSAFLNAELEHFVSIYLIGLLLLAEEYSLAYI